VSADLANAGLVVDLKEGDGLGGEGVGEVVFHEYSNI
jgi:hypothetical protein